jgi:DNA primase
MSRFNLIGNRAPRGLVTRFRRERLPTSIGYYAAEGLKLVGCGAWRSAICPFHNDKNPSLRIRVETGAFRCMACGAHGGDVIDFHRLRYSMTFVEAAQALGAWEV